MRSLFVGLVLAVLASAGCESVPDRMREGFSDVPAKSQVFAGAPKVVLAAAQRAFKQLDFVVTRSSPTHLEAASRIHSSEAFGDSRQLIVNLHLSEAGPGQTEVEMTITEQVQSQSVGGTSRTSPREHGFFATYFATLQQVLQEESATPADKKN